jgi:hypothetical protein
MKNPLSFGCNHCIYRFAIVDQEGSCYFCKSIFYHLIDLYRPICKTLHNYKGVKKIDIAWCIPNENSTFKSYPPSAIRKILERGHEFFNRHTESVDEKLIRIAIGTKLSPSKKRLAKKISIDIKPVKFL